MDRGGTTYTGTRASYVALSSITILAFALLSSIWITDVSGAVALLGLFSIYLASQELLVLFLVFCPASIIIDIIRLSHTHAPGQSGRGWLIFLQLLGMAAKVAGSIFAWSLYRSVAAGEAVGYAAPPPSSMPLGSAYQRVEDPFATAYAPPRSDFSPPAHPQQQQHQPAPAAAASPRRQQQQQAPAASLAPAAPHHDLV